MFRPAIALLLTAGLCCAPPGSEAAQTRALNYRPIIGILAQENLPNDPSPQGTSYIAASYVKHVESAGARVVPVRINRTEEEYVKLFNSINGLLLPGGDINIETSQFTRAAKIFYKLAIKANDAGDYFPLWGTCQGFQQLSFLTANKNLLTHTNTEAVALPLSFTPAEKWRMEEKNEGEGSEEREMRRDHCVSSVGGTSSPTSCRIEERNQGEGSEEIEMGHGLFESSRDSIWTTERKKTPKLCSQTQKTSPFFKFL